MSIVIVDIDGTVALKATATPTTTTSLTPTSPTCP